MTVAGDGDGLVLGLSAMCDVTSFMGAVAQRELRAENRRRISPSVHARHRFNFTRST